MGAFDTVFRHFGQHWRPKYDFCSWSSKSIVRRIFWCVTCSSGPRNLAWGCFYPRTPTLATICTWSWICTLEFYPWILPLNFTPEFLPLPGFWGCLSTASTVLGPPLVTCPISQMERIWSFLVTCLVTMVNSDNVAQRLTTDSCKKISGESFDMRYAWVQFSTTKWQHF